MQETRYDPISTTVPHDEDTTIDAGTRGNKASLTNIHQGELKDEEDLLLYETRTPNRQNKNRAASYKIVRIFTLGLVMAIIGTLLVLCTYMCITTECMSRNYKDLCQEGFCYDIDVAKFQDSNNDGIGDFIGIKQSLNFLRELGVQTLLLPLSSLKSTAEHNDEASFVQMAKEGIKLGISVVLHMDDSPNNANLELLHKINKTISGYIANKDSPFFTTNATWAQNLNCYTYIYSADDINKPKNNCQGTYLSVKNVADLSSDVVGIISNSKVTNSSVNILAVAPVDVASNRQEKFLASMMFASLSNGAISFRAGDELAANPNGNYSGALNSNNPYQPVVMAFLKNIKNNRQYSPKIGRQCALEQIVVDNQHDLKVLSKKCSEGGLEDFVAIYNQGEKEVTFAVTAALNNPAPVASTKVLFQSNPADASIVYPIEPVIVPPRSSVLIYVKYKATN